MTPEQERSLYALRHRPRVDADWMGPILGLYDEVSAFGADYQGRLDRTGSDIPPFDMARYAVRMLERRDAADWYLFGHFDAPTLESLEGIPGVQVPALPEATGS